MAIHHFYYLLEGRPFVAFTDHKPLTFAFAKTTDLWSSRQQCHLEYIPEFTTDVRYIEGKQNKVKDALLRTILNSLNATLPPINYLEKIAKAQSQDMEVKAYRRAITGLKLQDIAPGTSNITLLCGKSTGKAHHIIPHARCRRIFDLNHDLSHLSICTTRHIMLDCFVWHGISKQITFWAKTCIACQSSKIQQHIRSPLADFKVPARRFDHINVDIVGPLPTSQGFTYLFTMVDRTTKWPVAVPMTDATTSACARALITNWISRFGLLMDITSDHGPQLTSELWPAVAQLLGTHIHCTTAYHPQANGLVERFHRHLKLSLNARLKGPNWVYELPWVLFGIRTAPKEDFCCSMVS